MEIVDISETAGLKPSKPLMVWCTCAEKNGDLYLRRIASWRRQLSYLDADFYSFCDGEVPEGEDPGDLTMVRILPALGRTSLNCFPGWRRSLRHALQLSFKYDFCVHVENDCLVKCRDRLARLASTPGAVSVGWCGQHNFIEFACAVLNDKAVRRRLLDKHAGEASWHNARPCFENEAGWLGREHKLLGDSVRLERKQDRDSDAVQLVCQCPPELMDRLSQEAERRERTGHKGEARHEGDIQA